MGSCWPPAQRSAWPACPSCCLQTASAWAERWSVGRGPLPTCPRPAVANFPPFKAYILLTLGELAASHRLVGPFLDVGCGRGDVAAVLAGNGWHGKAIDISPAAVAAAAATLCAYPGVR